MNEKIISHTIRYPHARATTIQYLAKREEMTERLRREATMAYQKELCPTGCRVRFPR